MTHPLIEVLFVYGTLQPGDVRWHLLEPYVMDAGRPDAVAGELFDTGLGYPAARFGAPGGVIHGRCYTLRSGLLDDALTVLDTEEHSVPGDYRRVVVTTRAGEVAWAYEYGSGLDLLPIPSGNWLAR
jgi:gamma-glutamylcyclotransferase (GGCT)/AIG2-like uncharacterized protein YtfP